MTADGSSAIGGPCPYTDSILYAHFPSLDSAPSVSGRLALQAIIHPIATKSFGEGRHRGFLYLSLGAYAVCN